MKNKGFTLLEILVSTAIASLIAIVLLVLFLASRNYWITVDTYTDLQQCSRQGMDVMVKELLQTSSSQVTISRCGEYSSLPTSCSGDIISFRLPISDDNEIEGTIYKPDGTIKWGDIDAQLEMSSEGRNINFFASSSSKLTRRSWEILACFLSGTKILMADHTSKPIEEIKAGDEIMAYDEETKHLVKDKVSRFFENTANQYLIINGHLKVTPRHPVYSQNKWVEIGSLKVGDTLFNSEGKEELIKDIKAVSDKVKVYNLEVNPYHTYFADGYLAHNKKGGTYLSSDTKDIAPNIVQVNFTGFAATGEQIDTNPSMVEITIRAQRRPPFGRVYNFNLTSRVSLRN